MTGKTWGPFTGSQLTIVIVAVALCFAIPGGLWAAATIPFTYVSLWDPGAKVRAKVVKGGGVMVSDGKGPMTVDGAIAINGGVSEAAPSSLMRFNAEISGTSCVAVLAAPSTNGIVLSRLIFDTYVNGTPGPSTGLFFYIGTMASACSPFNPTFSIHPPALTMNDVDLHPGFAIPAGSFLWAKALGGVQADVYGSGYFVPASALPVATAMATQVSGAASRTK